MASVFVRRPVWWRGDSNQIRTKGARSGNRNWNIGTCFQKCSFFCWVCFSFLEAYKPEIEAVKTGAKFGYMNENKSEGTKTVRKDIVLMSSIQLICIMILLLIMSMKERLSKNLVDLGTVFVLIIMLLALVWFICAVIHKNGMGK